MVVNHVSFPRSEENVPEEEHDKGAKTEYAYNEKFIAQPFGGNEENDNGPLDEEESTIEEVQVFHHVPT